ncbi:plasmid stabilization protein [Synechococcus sp. CS-1325]|uniref:FitA-like ribbon-helix-helix domain-containing protein n=1 Tax=Synechococcus sp. CS-1325 TaxID=2847979 RepID=UPI000DB69CFD|nr:plasmid stabilization protein [Synechococcus sp. CS-1325]MCT0199071.1 plasmid stabilization protein [Synechococcus sp. CS-1325]PZU99500.1 MAG: plasmid stabilization protein [Cyanobium sp.]
MASLTIRNLDNATKARLRLQAARHGCSMEEEARTILRQAVAASPEVPAGPGLGSRIQAHFASCGGVELDLPARVSMAAAARFDGEQA